MAKTPYDIDLDRNPANYQPLTPLGFLERAAAVFPDHAAVIHGPLRRNYAEFYVRSRRLASALAKRGIRRGDTVSVVRKFPFHGTETLIDFVPSTASYSKYVCPVPREGAR